MSIKICENKKNSFFLFSFDLVSKAWKQYENYGHVSTDDLRIITNYKLRNLQVKVPIFVKQCQ